MFNSCIEKNNIEFKYLFSTKDRNQIEKYFKMKKKYEYKFDEQEEKEFIDDVVKTIGTYDIVIHPQTSGYLLNDIAKRIGSKVIEIKKNNKSFIREKLLEQNFMKLEKETLLNTIDKMDSDFKINLIKGNQRKRFINILFKDLDQDIEENKSILLLDDSIFSGETFLAMCDKIKIKTDKIVLFSKY